MRSKSRRFMMILLAVLSLLSVLLPPVLYHKGKSAAAKTPVTFSYTPRDRMSLSAAETAALYQSLPLCYDIGMGSFVRDGNGEEDSRREEVKALLTEIFKEDPEVLSSLSPLLSEGTLYSAKDAVLLTVAERPVVMHFIYAGIRTDDGILTLLYEEHSRALLSLTYHVSLGEVELPIYMELWEAVEEERLSAPILEDMKQRLMYYTRETLGEEEEHTLFHQYAYERPVGEGTVTMLVLEYELAYTEEAYDHAQVIFDIQEALISEEGTGEAER